ncbi:unnamed protein product, partial [Effrenium voratum]
ALEAEVEAEVQIQEAWMEHIQLTLKAPLLLARGDVMPQRCGVLLVLQAKSGDGELAGLGEVTPLPLFHKETLAEAQAQLAAVLQHWSASKPRVAPAKFIKGQWIPGYFGHYWLCQAWIVESWAHAPKKASPAAKSAASAVGPKEPDYVNPNVEWHQKVTDAVDTILDQFGMDFVDKQPLTLEEGALVAPMDWQGLGPLLPSVRAGLEMAGEPGESPGFAKRGFP